MADQGTSSFPDDRPLEDFGVHSMKRTLLTLVLAAALGGCAQISHLATMLTPPPEAPPAPPVMDSQKAVFVDLPEDGGSASLWYVGSGRVVATAIADAFSRRGVPVCVSPRRLANDDVLFAAARAKAGYAVRPVITRWEPRNEWLGNPSRLIIRISVIDVASARIIASSPVESFTFYSSIATPAADALLAGPLTRYLNTLY
jgi:hypothetical protein